VFRILVELTDRRAWQAVVLFADSADQPGALYIGVDVVAGAVQQPVQRP
jgi:hypothetical protein